MARGTRCRLSGLQLAARPVQVPRHTALGIRPAHPAAAAPPLRCPSRIRWCARVNTYLGSGGSDRVGSDRAGSSAGGIEADGIGSGGIGLDWIRSGAGGWGGEAPALQGEVSPMLVHAVRLVRRGEAEQVCGAGAPLQHGALTSGQRAGPLMHAHLEVRQRPPLSARSPGG